MAIFSIETRSACPTTDLNFSIEIPDAAGREYTTVVNAGIAAVVAQAGALLIAAENEQDICKCMETGMAMVKNIGK